MRQPRVAVLTVSDRASRGERPDLSGEAVANWVVQSGWDLVGRGLVPDDKVAIASWLMTMADGGRADLILTTGGTGLSPRDVTPEATSVVLEREAPGIVEAIRAAELASFPRAALSRGVAGVRGRCLIVNLPGSPAGVATGLKILGCLVEHAVQLLRGDPTDHD